MEGVAARETEEGAARAMEGATARETEGAAAREMEGEGAAMAVAARARGETEAAAAVRGGRRSRCRRMAHRWTRSGRPRREARSRIRRRLHTLRSCHMHTLHRLQSSLRRLCRSQACRGTCQARPRWASPRCWPNRNLRGSAGREGHQRRPPRPRRCTPARWPPSWRMRTRLCRSWCCWRLFQ